MIGDLFDLRFLGRHGTGPDPDDPDSPSSEYLKALAFKVELFSKLPIREMCDSNHSDRLMKRGKDAYIPQFCLKNEQELLQIPKSIKIARGFIHYGGQVLIEHGHRIKSLSSTRSRELVLSRGCSVVIGHHSSQGGIQYYSTLLHDALSARRQLFLMNVGGMINESSYGMAWARDFIARTTQGHGVLVWDKVRRMVIPHFIPFD